MNGYRKFDLLVSSMGMKSCSSQRPWIGGREGGAAYSESCKKHPMFNINPLSVGPPSEGEVGWSGLKTTAADDLLTEH